MACSHQAESLIYHVATNGADTPPYLSWTSAARTLQAAVNLTTNGDTVIVGEGTYSGFGATYYGPNVVVITNGITLISSNNAESTWIDGGGSNRCVLIANTGAVVEGFTILRGYVTASNPVDTAFIDYVNYAACGGGVFIQNGGTLRACTVRDNLAHGILYAVDVFPRPPGARGGGIYAKTATNNGYVMIDRCAVESNAAITSSRTNGYYGGSPYGGGVFLQGANGTNASGVLRNSRVAGNLVTCSNIINSAEGAGAMLTRTALVQGCTFTGNYSVNGNGGGLSLDRSRAIGCIVRNNRADLSGGGVTLYTRATLLNSVVAENSGGGCISSGYSNHFISCVIVLNTNIGVSGIGVANGLTIRDPDRAVNNIVRYNYDKMGQEDNWEYSDGFSPYTPFTIDYSCLFPLPTSGVGNITLDPVFADEIFRPAPASPCVDAGPSSTVDIGASDFNGVARILNGRADIGAFEAWEWGSASIRAAASNAITWNVVSGAVCRMERSTDLMAQNWTPIGSTATGGPAPLIFGDMDGFTSAHYRIRALTP
ncbi:MAG: hypothetical protein KA248_12255 [Kiritimatiellae bacterium]|nr:hypothetical protein [Kiritimatiellia bacterium]